MSKLIHILDRKGNCIVAGIWNDNDEVELKSYVKDINNKYFYYDERYYKKPSKKKILQKFVYICKKVENI